MKKPNLFDIGCVHCFTVFNCDVDKIRSVVLEKNCSAIVFYNSDNFPFALEDDPMMIYLFHSFNRKAFDIYRLLNGVNIRVIDPVVVQSMLSTIGISDAKGSQFIKIPLDLETVS